MGIRVRKCIGYGLTDLKENDERINPLGYLGEDVDWKDQHKIWKEDNYAEYYKNHSDFAIYYRSLKENRWDIYKQIHYDREYGLKNVLLIIPPSHKDWQRYDDIIDYVESPSGAKNKVKILTSGIWPYTGRWYDLKNNEDLFEIRGSRRGMYAREFWFSYHSSTGLKKTNKRYEIFQAEMQYCVKKLGFNSIKEVKKYIVPKVPDEVILFCKWLNLFNYDFNLFELKPMIYTYWS